MLSIPDNAFRIQSFSQGSVGSYEPVNYEENSRIFPIDGSIKPKTFSPPQAKLPSALRQDGLTLVLAIVSWVLAYIRSFRCEIVKPTISMLPRWIANELVMLGKHLAT